MYKYSIYLLCLTCILSYDVMVEYSPYSMLKLHLYILLNKPSHNQYHIICEILLMDQAPSFIGNLHTFVTLLIQWKIWPEYFMSVFKYLSTVERNVHTLNVNYVEVYKLKKGISVKVFQYWRFFIERFWCKAQIYLKHIKYILSVL